MADQHGCGVNRRTGMFPAKDVQKIWKEVPSPVLTPTQRKAMMELVTLDMEEFGYFSSNTGFLYEEGVFYFIEINTVFKWNIL